METCPIFENTHASYDSARQFHSTVTPVTPRPPLAISTRDLPSVRVRLAQSGPVPSGARLQRPGLCTFIQLILFVAGVRVPTLSFLCSVSPQTCSPCPPPPDQGASSTRSPCPRQADIVCTPCSRRFSTPGMPPSFAEHLRVLSRTNEALHASLPSSPTSLPTCLHLRTPVRTCHSNSLLYSCTSFSAFFAGVSMQNLN